MIFLLSTGHSGSTLLDMLLGSGENMWSHGELHYLQEDNAQRLRCGCGKVYQDREFWRSVDQKVDLHDEEYPTNYFQLPETKLFFQRLKWLVSITIGRPIFIDPRAIEGFAQSNVKLLAPITLSAKECFGEDIQWFIDATKHGHRLFWLLQDPRFEIRLIRLVKYPQAFVFSMIRDKFKISFLRVIRYYLVWSFDKFLFLRMLQLRDWKTGPSSIQYGKLASQPNSTINHIADDLDIPIRGISFDNLHAKQNHAVGGNPRRLKMNETQIRLDQKWKHRLPGKYAVLICSLCWPVALRLGYSCA